LLSGSRYEIEGQTKLLISLRWNWNTLIPVANGKIVLARTLNLVELFILKNYETRVQKQIQYIVFSRGCYIWFSEKQDAL